MSTKQNLDDIRGIISDGISAYQSAKAARPEDINSVFKDLSFALDCVDRGISSYTLTPAVRSTVEYYALTERLEELSNLVSRKGKGYSPSKQRDSLLLRCDATRERVILLRKEITTERGVTK